jgi:nucleoid-associated protein YgaU
MKFLLLNLVALTIFISCAKSKKTNENKGVDLADADEFLLDDQGFDNTGVTNQAGSGALEDPSFDTSANNIEGDLFAANEVNMNEQFNQPSVQTDQSDLNGSVQEYRVQANETLMMIAFKIYGDYEKWRELKQFNPQLNGMVKQGDIVRYNAPAQVFNWQPEGNPYLIKRNDTLGSISQSTYGEKKYWKEIWNNNKPLIKDPNLIFAGFTIYTPRIDGRDVASKF